MRVICCTIIAALLALLMRPLAAFATSPLAWRLEAKAAQPFLRNRTASFGFALAGIHFTLRNEPNMRIHIGAAALTITAGAWLRVEAEDWRWLILVMALVLAAEAFNTAIEQCCNSVTLEHRPAIKAAKDIAAGAVLITAISAMLIGAIIFLPYLKRFAWPDRVPLSALICGQTPTKPTKWN
jgi:diacylglycerol kinase